MTMNRRWEVEKMRRWERLSAAKMMTTQRLIIIRGQKTDDREQITSFSVPYIIFN
jgi:hypothetical protein